MSYEKRLLRRRRKNIFTIIISLVIIFLLFNSFLTLFIRNTKTTLAERIVVRDSIPAQGFLIKKESLVKSKNNGLMDLIASEGERLASGRQVVAINTLKDISSLEYELKEIEENISLFEKKETESELIVKERDKITGIREELVLELQENILSKDFTNVIVLKEQLLLYDEKYKNVDFSKSLVGQGIESLKDRKESITDELSQNHIKYFSNNSGVISYEIDGYEERYLPKDFENYTYDSLNVDNITKTIRDEKSKVSVNEPIFKIIDNFEWYMAIKIEDSEEISKYSPGNKIKIYIDIDEKEEEIRGNIVAINNSGDKSVVVVKFNTMFHKIYNLRFPMIDIVKEEINGYKIPSKVIVNIDNMDGVYVKDRSGIVRFRPVSIFKEDNNYAYIYPGDMDGNIFLNNEAMMTISMFDEILINPNKIEEGDIL